MNFEIKKFLRKISNNFLRIYSTNLMFRFQIITFLLLTAMFAFQMHLIAEIKELDFQGKMISNELSFLVGHVIEERLYQNNRTQFEKKIINDMKAIQMSIETYEQMLVETKIDYALESGGANILSIGKTKSIPKYIGIIERLSFFFQYGHLPVPVNVPQKLLQPSIRPGECFAFTGEGEVTIQLIRSIHVKSVCIEHILQTISPDQNISNAPKDFSVYGLNNKLEHPLFLGRFRYKISKHKILQEFYIVDALKTKYFAIIRFLFHSNHGNDDNTCVYRVRVHGSLHNN